MDIILSILGFFAGAALSVLGGAFVLMLVLPIYAAFDIFVNRPDGNRSGIHFFTKVAPGQVKIIVRGKRPVRMIMNTAGKKFARTGKKDSPEYWQIVPGESEDPTADIMTPFQWWARLIYNQTGAVFTGIYPFQRVYEYDLERTIVERKEEGRGIGESNIVLRIKRDVSDHLRTRQFLYPMHITAAETKDKIPLDIIGVAEMEVINPHKAAYGTDRWDHAVINLVTDKVTALTKRLPLDHALTADEDGETRKIAEEVRGIRDDEIECGINISNFRILEINPALDAAGLKAIQAEAIASQQAKATIKDGQARSQVIRDINEANAAGGEHSIATMEAEALVRAADAAGKGGGTVILMPGQGKGNGAGTDPTQVAILAELRKLNQQRGKK